MNPNLSDEQKDILFNKGTEAPFSGAHLNEDREGVFSCVNCGHQLFDSGTKFDSGTGWPSFSEVSASESVTTQQDTSHGMIRTEVLCANCGVHLGHLFPYSGTDTGKDYCINSACLEFSPTESKDE